MVKAVMVYRTEDGKDFDSEKEAVQHERQSNAERRLMDMLIEAGVDNHSTIGEIVHVLIDNRDEIKGAFYFLDNG